MSQETDTSAPPPDAAPAKSDGYTFPAFPHGVIALEAATALFVAAPILIFVGGWLRPLIAVWLFPAICAAMGWGCWRAVRWAGEHAQTGALRRVDLGRGLRLVAIVAFLVACTGVGGLTFQFYDYWLYDSHLKALVVQPWPMGAVSDYPDPNTRMPGASYWAYWLPAALFGRLFGWEPGYLFQYFWNTFGVLLAIVWFLRIVGTARLRYALMFLFFSGLDLIGYLAVSPLPDGRETTWYDYLTGTYWWSVGRGWMAHWSSTYALLLDEGRELTGGVFLRFYGVLPFLSDGPHHIFPAAVIVLVVLHDALRRKTVERLFFLTSFLPLCSVFATLGTVPLLGLAMWHTRGRGAASAGNLFIGPLLVGMFALYFRSIESELPSGFLWNFQNVAGNLWFIALHCACGFLIYAAIAPGMRGDGYRPGRAWFFAALAVFLLAPWYRMGVFGDFTTKVVVPMQLVFLVCLATALRRPEGPWARMRQRALAVALVVGAWAGLGVVVRALHFGFDFSPPPIERVAFSADQLGDAPDALFRFHPDNFFWTHLARPVAYVRAPENEVARRFDLTSPRELLEDWYFFDENAEHTPEGVRMVVGPDTPLVRRYMARLDARRLGSVQLDYTLVDAGGNTPDHMVVLQWATVEEVVDRGEEWPFHRFSSSVLHPPPSPRQPLSSNPYWRGDLDQFALYLAVPDADPADRFTVTVRELRFMAR